MSNTIIIESNYIHQDAILSSIYVRAVVKFMKPANQRVVFVEVAEYIAQQLSWKKQCLYTHSLPLLKEVCQRIGEDFQAGCEFACANPKNYRDLYYAIIEA